MKRLIVIFIAICCLSAPITARAANDTLYGIGSVSKVFTAAAVMKLVETGHMELDEPLVTYIPDFTMADERYVSITPRMLLNHSSGLMGTTGRDSFLVGEISTDYIDHFLDHLSRQRLRHDPGERSIYCNDGFTLAEILVERVSGMGFTEFIRREFLEPLDIQNIYSPQSDFDRSRLADTYLGNKPLQPQALGLIGTGGLYATPEDLCRYATIFMDNANAGVLSKQSVQTMAMNHHQMELLLSNTDTVFRYGLGWDAVDTYPFNQFGIQALSKGGSTTLYHTSLTVLPEYNLAATVTSSGIGGREQIIAQEIILAVLIEEGLLPSDTVLTLPELNLEPALIPNSVKMNAGIYDTGYGFEMYQADFSDTILTLTPIASHNERPLSFLYNSDGVFTSLDGNAITFSHFEDSYGISTLTFQDDYLMVQTYHDVPRFGQSVFTMPFAQKLESLSLPNDIIAAWSRRNEKEYLLVSDQYASLRYISHPIAKTLTDDRAPGYVKSGLYQGRSGIGFPTAKIADENTALAFQITPTMVGRDVVDLSAQLRNGIEYLNFNNGDSFYMDAAYALKYSELEGYIVIRDEAVWVDVEAEYDGQIIHIHTPQNGSWFVYDDKMDCIATSLEQNLRDSIILPKNGRLAFVGQPGAEFYINTPQ